jgi:cytochrome oxidase Cu insertion factor (SCO1/SenC/PrrC family)
MASSAKSKIDAEPKSVRRIPGDWLDAGDRRVIAIGVGVSLIMALGLGALMWALVRSDAVAADPDAARPVIEPDYQRHLVSFSLTDQASRVVTRQDLQGKIVVVDFLFTSCSLTCPFVNAQMEKIQAATSGRPEVRLVSLTLDPADDTVPVLAKYATGFNADPARWSFLTGDSATMRSLVGASFLPPDTTGEFSYMPGNFAHIQRIVLVDRSGQVVKYFDGLNPNAANFVLNQIRELEGSP